MGLLINEYVKPKPQQKEGYIGGKYNVVGDSFLLAGSKVNPISEYNPVQNLKYIDRHIGVPILFGYLFIRKEVHKGERVKRLHLPVIGIGINKKKPEDFNQLRDKEYQLCDHRNTPALLVGNAVAPKKAANPEAKCNQRELPGIDDRYGDELHTCLQIKCHALVHVHKPEGSNLINDEILFYIQQHEGNQANEHKEQSLVDTKP
jgi:hypothetical protein